MGAHPAEPEIALGVVDRVARLREPAWRLLRLASCLGAVFDLGTLSTASGHRVAVVVAELQPVVAAGLLLDFDPLAGRRLAFCVPVADVYALIPASELPELHLSIGRRLLAEGVAGAELQLAVEHLGRGARMLEVSHAEAQRQLALHERLAALGTLAAGVAHEIRNPLGLVNNFAELSVNLSSELVHELARSRPQLDPDRAARLDELVAELVHNVARIRAHSGRADAIVHSMLEHSRGRAGQLRDVDLNALVRAYALAATEARRDVDGSALELSVDDSMRSIRVVPEDIGRVVVNLVSNALYAAEAHRAARGEGFTPVVRVSTRDLGGHVEVRVRDNGAGIPAGLRGRVCTPFFTTKPPGEGTGLGLSLSREIIVQGHGGSLAFECEEDAFTEFVVTLPRRGSAPADG